MNAAWSAVGHSVSFRPPCEGRSPRRDTESESNHLTSAILFGGKLRKFFRGRRLQEGLKLLKVARLPRGRIVTSVASFRAGR